MIVKSLEIENFRDLKDLKIKFDKDFEIIRLQTVQTCKNVLDSIAISIAPYVSYFPSAPNKKLKKEDILISEEAKSCTITISSFLNSQEIEKFTTLKISKDNSKKSMKAMQEYAKNIWLEYLQEDKEDRIFPVISYYDYESLIKNPDPREGPYILSRGYAYHNCLDPEKNCKDYRNWCKDMCYSEVSEYMNETLDTGKPPSKETLLKCKNKDLQVLRDTLSKVSTTSKLFENNVFSFEFKDPSNPKDEIYLKILSLIADIAYRCVKLNPAAKDPCKETNGIVLLSITNQEIDLVWLEEELSKAFPKIQFILAINF